MAVYVWTDARVEVNSVDLSTYIRKVTLKTEADVKDATAMGGSGWAANKGGLKKWTVSLEPNQDFDAAKVDATLWPLLGATPTIKLRPTTAAVGATNPEYSGPALLNNYTPIDGAVGDMSVSPAEFTGAGTLARAVA